MKNVLVVLAAVTTACGSETSAPRQQPSLSIVAGDNQVDTIGSTLPIQIAAAVTDRTTGAPLPGRVVNWIIAGGGGSVFVPVTQTGNDGIARNTYTLGSSVGVQKLLARYIDPDTGTPITDTAFATALPGRPTLLWANNEAFPHPDGIAWVLVPVTPGAPFSVYFGFQDRNRNARRCTDLVTWTYAGNNGFPDDTVRVNGPAVATAVDSLTWRQDFVITGPGASLMNFTPQAACNTKIVDPLGGVPVLYQP